MRRAFNILLVAAGVMVSVIGSQSKTPANRSFHNIVVVDQLHVALPDGMKNFPAGLVPLP